MKKLLLSFIFVLLIIPFAVDAKEANLYLFYGDGCPHCADLKEYLDRKYSNDDELNIYKYEVWYDYENQKIWEEVQDVTGEVARGVPYFVIGEEVFQGYSAGSTWEKKVDNAIRKAKKGDYTDNVGIALGVVDGKIEKEKPNKDEPNYDPEKKETDLKEYKEENTSDTTLDVPIIGTISLKDMSISAIAVVMGLVDGFNPCAMWILLFLITMLLDYPNRKRMWILGCTFLFASAFIYFLFMISFLNIAMFMNSIMILKILIASFALIFGGYNIYRYIKSKDSDVGCDVVNKDKRKKIITRIKNILASKSFVLSLGGIILLAVSVNLIELLCSLGLPVMFTEILAHNNITGVKNIFYIIIYIIFFLLDDLVVFFVAMKTLKITAISNRYSKYSHLIGGIIMIAIGLLMLFKPEWLMFNF